MNEVSVSDTLEASYHISIFDICIGIRTSWNKGKGSLLAFNRVSLTSGCELCLSLFEYAIFNPYSRVLIYVFVTIFFYKSTFKITVVFQGSTGY